MNDANAGRTSTELSVSSPGKAADTKKSIFMRVVPSLYEHLLDVASELQKTRKSSISVPAVVIEQLEWLRIWQSNFPDEYKKAQQAVDALPRS